MLTHKTFATLTLAALASMSLFAGQKVFKQTSEYRKEAHGYLNEKFDTYAQMCEEPKGTSCDWVFRDPAFDLENIRTTTVTYFAASTVQEGNLGFLFGNPIVQSFESGLQGLGIQLVRADGSTAVAMNNDQVNHDRVMAQKQAIIADNLKHNPSALESMISAQMYDPVENQVEVDRRPKRTEGQPFPAVLCANSES